MAVSFIGTLLLVTLLPLSLHAQTQECSNGKVYLECGSPCTQTCDNYQTPAICLAMCEPGCFCPGGTVEHNGQCISPTECPSEATTEPPTPWCPEGMHFEQCGCHATCNDPQSRECDFGCTVGCFCPEGTVELNYRCVAVEDCPASTEPITLPPASEAATEPPTPWCPEGMHFEQCGCHATCDDPETRECEFGCTVGCFCPEGTVELNYRCVAVEDCPATTEPPTPWCPEGMHFEQCGCHATCDDPESAECDFGCTAGCFCPEGTVELNYRCVTVEDCPATTEPPTPWCPEGMHFEQCGCHATCDDPESRECEFGCTVGCFCPEGTVELNYRCVAVEDCPVATTTEEPVTVCSAGKVYKECGPVCTETCETKYGDGPNPCFSLRCFSGCFCPEGTVEHEGQCIEDTACPNHPCNGFQCPDDFHCELDEVPVCKRSVYVPCTADVPLACDSDFLRCVVENTTRHATCLPSCFLDNGNCHYDETCVVDKNVHGSTVHCLSPAELSTECPAGMVMNECGSLCQETCDDVLSGGVKICPLICGPADCACPAGLVRYRDRCVDPKECYSLQIYPPNVNPLPAVRTDVALIKLTPQQSVSKSDFSDIQDLFLGSLEQALSDRIGAKVELHAVLESDGRLEVYVMLSGGDVSAETVQSYIDSFTADSLHLPIDDIVIVDLPQVDNSRHGRHQHLLGLIVGVVVAVVLIVTTVAVTACCCVFMSRRRRKQQTKEKQFSPPPTYSLLVSEGIGPVPEKK